MLRNFYLPINSFLDIELEELWGGRILHIQNDLVCFCHLLGDFMETFN